MTKPSKILFALCLLFALSGCAQIQRVVPFLGHPSTQPKAVPLYDRLGGDAGLSAIVDDLVPRAAADPRVNFTRKSTTAEWKPSPENVALLKQHLVQFLARATGGPDRYEGKDMKTVHQPMQISNDEFSAFADDLRQTLIKLKVPAKEQDELVGLVESTRRDIVKG